MGVDKLHVGIVYSVFEVDVRGVPIKIGMISFWRAIQIVGYTVQDADLFALQSNGIVSQKSPFVKSLHLFHIFFRPGAADFYQFNPVGGHGFGQSHCFGMGDDILSRQPKRGGELYLLGACKRFHLDESAVFMDDTSLKVRLIFIGRCFNDGWREGYRSERPKTGLYEVNPVHVVGTVHRHQLGNARCHNETRYTAGTTFLEH